MKEDNSQPTFYITSPIFYPNANLHIGHAYTMVLCDVFSRYHKLKGEKVYFLTGSDENSSKIIEAAEKEGMTPADFLSGTVSNFKELFSSLDISYDQFIRTTDKEVHWSGAQKLWQKLEEAGDIYKDSYTGLYCVGCEAFVTEKELVDGKCPDHDQYPQKIEEENYFFRLSKYGEAIKEKIEKDELLIVPSSRKQEILSFLTSGLEDVSFSRPAKEIPWGIPVPGDSTQTMYVWCDALSNYISALGYGSSYEKEYGRDDDSLFHTFWPADVHVIGKDILKFHAAIWPAMLLSAGLPLPHSILVHGFITSGGRKMSKSLGNVISPTVLIEKYGEEALRYYLTREVSPFEDGDLTEERFKESYNAHLANGLGNLVSRVLKMAISYEVEVEFQPKEELWTQENLPTAYIDGFDNFSINHSLDYVWQEISELDSFIQKTEPFKKIKVDVEGAKEDVAHLLTKLWTISLLLEPFMPVTATTIQELLREKKMPEKPLFKRMV